MRKKALLVLSVLAVGFIAVAESPIVNGQSVQTAGTVTVPKDQTHDGTLYGFGDSVSVAGTVNGDVICAGQSIVIGGTVNGDVICAGQTVVVDGTINGDVRVAGQTITVNGDIDGSLSVAGQTVLVNSDTTVGRDMNGFGQSITMGGEVGRDVMLGSSQALIGGAVGRNFNGSFEKVTMSGDASVAGDAVFEAHSSNIDEGVVAGETKRSEPRAREYGRGYGSDASAAFKVFRVLAIFVLSMALVLLFPSFLRRTTDITIQRSLVSSLLGLTALVITPVVAILVALTIFGIPLSLFLMFAWALALMISVPVASYYVGRRLFGTYTDNAVANMAAGVALVLLATSIPYIGGLLLFIGTCMGLGMIALALFKGWSKPNYTA